MVTDIVSSWGRVFRLAHRVARPAWLTAIPALLSSEGPHLAYGLGRSYGDSCLNGGGSLIMTAALNRFRSADWTTGIITCEAGLSIAEILKVAVPRGFMLPVTPGTKFITIGGAVANDVHGKNHHGAGTFGCHVLSLELLRSDGARLRCSRSENADLFAATIGGLGLTGFITQVELKLKRAGAMILQEAIPFVGLSQFIALAAAADHSFEYTVAWLDTTARGRKLGRGIFFRGNHVSGKSAREHEAHEDGQWRVPCDLPTWALNRHSVQAFNGVYFWAQSRSAAPTAVHYDPFFYPLDSVSQWNRIYGPKGFYQYQLVVPRGREEELEAILEAVAASGAASFLAVLKVFGAVPSPGLLSFPLPGYTLALDFKNSGARTLALFKTLDALVARADGRLYPAKDGHMDGAMFRAGFPALTLTKFAGLRDPGFSSSFWRRVMGND